MCYERKIYNNNNNNNNNNKLLFPKAGTQLFRVHSGMLLPVCTNVRKVKNEVEQ